MAPRGGRRSEHEARGERGWQLSCEHATGYRYASPVTSSYNEARMTPLTTDIQATLDAELSITPVAGTFRYWDYWGTLVHAFDLHEPHTELLVRSRAVVETSRPAPPANTVGWEALGDDGVRDRFAELLVPGTYTTASPNLRDAARDTVGGLDPLPAVEALATLVRSELAYVPGATGVSTSAAEAWAARQGVCQDFAHVLLSLLRTAGIPARYVSGYLHPAEDATIGVASSGASHAWVEAWVGDWWGVDPTNGRPAGPGHVLVGRGRDYADVAPLRGVFRGGAAEELAVDVVVTRLA
jgi:transglutaminase-like putative cysteine protease